MRRFAIFIISFCCLYFLVIGTSNQLMKKFKEIVSEFEMLQSQKFKYGDLYGFSYLSDYKIFRDDKTNFKAIPSEKIKNINLFYVCDSYLWDFIKKDSIEYQFRSFQQAIWDRSNLVFEKLDTNQTNVLLIERTERDAKSLIDTNIAIQKINPNKTKTTESKSVVQTAFDFIDHVFYNDKIESNLEIVLFDYAVFNPFKEFKAAINHLFFGRVDKDVAISTDKKHLFYKKTVFGKVGTNSFAPYSNAELNKFVSSLNYLSKKYKNEGFDEVFFSFPPNPATILEKNMGQYNQFLPRLASHPALEANLIDVYQEFKNQEQQIYYNSDTHWNYTGFNLWLHKFYQKLDCLKSKENTTKQE